MMSPLFTGVATALLTPFCDTGIDYAALEVLLDRQISSGVGAVVLAGTTGESPTLDYNEYRELLSFSKARLAGKLPLIAGCGANCTSRACELAAIAASVGADGLLSVTPYYNKASANGLVLHYRAIAEAASLPVLVYNVPARTGVSLKIEDYRRLSRIPGVCGVKEASGDLALLSATVGELGDRFAVYTGCDEQTLPSVKLGARGVISVYSNLDPAGMVSLTDAALAGDLARAQAIDAALSDRMRSLFWEVNPIPVKFLAARMGLCRPLWRLPLCPPSEEVAKRLEKLWAVPADNNR